MSTLTRLGILCLMCALVLLLGEKYADRASVRAVSEPGKALAIGLLAQILFIPVLVVTIVVLVVTIIGIPLLLLIPFAVMGLAIVGLVGFTGVAHLVGERVGQRLGWAVGNPYAATVLGVLTVMSPVILARIVGLAGFITLPFSFGLGLLGGIVEYVAWTIGFGSVALMRFSRPSPTPPAVVVGS